MNTRISYCYPQANNLSAWWQLIRERRQQNPRRHLRSRATPGHTQRAQIHFTASMHKSHDLHFGILMNSVVPTASYTQIPHALHWLTSPTAACTCVLSCYHRSAVAHEMSVGGQAVDLRNLCGLRLRSSARRDQLGCFLLVSRNARCPTDCGRTRLNHRAATTSRQHRQAVPEWWLDPQPAHVGAQVAQPLSSMTGSAASPS